jgi:flagellin
MSIYLQTNTASLAAEEGFNESQMSIQGDFTKLSTGYKINTAADDAAGLGLATSLNAQVTSYTAASQNANDGVNMVQTADGSAAQIDSLLTQMRSLSVESQNGTMNASDQTNLNTEFQSDLSEINRVAGDATFNGNSLLAGAANTVSFQVGINGTTSDQISVSFGGADVSGLGLTGTTVTSAGILATIDAATQSLSAIRAGFGSAINRLNGAATNIASTQTNLSSALANVQDTDIAATTADLARQQVLAQAGASVLSQANQAPQLALKLLQ